MNDTRLFFVTEGEITNQELFETLEEARKWAKRESKEDGRMRIYIAMVKNAYKEQDLGGWNYEDRSDTFEFIKEIK